MGEVPPLWLKTFHCMKQEGTGRHLLKMRRGRGKGNRMKEKEDKIVEKVGRMLDCNNTGQGQGMTGKTQNMSQATLLKSITLIPYMSAWYESCSTTNLLLPVAVKCRNCLGHVRAGDGPALSVRGASLIER